jgi:hypothetical protein
MTLPGALFGSPMVASCWLETPSSGSTSLGPVKERWVAAQRRATSPNRERMIQGSGERDAGFFLLVFDRGTLLGPVMRPGRRALVEAPARFACDVYQILIRSSGFR